MSQVSIGLSLHPSRVAQRAGAGRRIFPNPTWPCVQNGKWKTCHFGLMWPYPVPEGELAAELQSKGR